MGIKTIDELGMDEMGSYIRHKSSSFLFVTVVKLDFVSFLS